MATSDAKNPKYAELAQSDGEAQSRFDEWKSWDPFPDIAPALLNSSDIYDYVRLTGMVFPFCQDTNHEKKLKPASYEIDFRGTVHIVSPEEGRIIRRIEEQKKLCLPKNSIAFVFLATKLRLPDYIAVRFNLRIKLVHRGLLLGTGPLVDPGFEGQLLIPLHNLTSEPVELVGGEGLIWVEFTKISPNQRWDESARPSVRSYAQFSSSKKNRSAEQYFEDGAPDAKPAQSSIPQEILAARKGAEDARTHAESARIEAGKASQDVESAKSLLNMLSLLGVAALVALVISIYSLVRDAQQSLNDSTLVVTEVRKEYREGLPQQLAQFEKSSEEKQAILQRKIEEMDIQLKALSPLYSQDKKQACKASGQRDRRRENSQDACE